MPSRNRRQFLQSTLAGASGLALPALLTAADPPVRNGQPHFKLSLAAYSFNKFLPRNWPQARNGSPTMRLEDVIDFAAKLNLDGVELTSYYFPRDVTTAYLRTLQERCFRLGLDISGTAIGNNFCLANGPERDADMAMTRQWIDYAAQLGTPVIRIFAGKTPKGDTEAAALDRCVVGINDAVRYAAEKGVALALENHGGVTATPEQLLSIVRRVEPSPWFGINFDSGNFRTADPYGDLEKIAPYAINAQIKVAMHPNGQPQPADMGRIVEILKRANYRGYVVLEYEEAEDPQVAIPRYIDELRKLIGSSTGRGRG
ncbi:MAG: sugar phosphate isomerase/epimerase family protein [Planctomycetaceae bacterium]